MWNSLNYFHFVQNGANKQLKLNDQDRKGMCGGSNKLLRAVDGSQTLFQATF